MAPSERAALTTLGWTAGGAATALVLLPFPAGDTPLTTATVHLAAVVVYGIGLSFRLVGMADPPWFEGMATPRRRRCATSIWLVTLVAGSVGLVALATSAGLRYDPSMQFLQVLSAVDIAWAAASIAVGVSWWRGRGPAGAGVALLAVVCIWSIWRYLSIVGFGPEGSWRVDADRMSTLVLPYDVAAALMAAIALWLGAHHPHEAVAASDRSAAEPPGDHLRG